MFVLMQVVADHESAFQPKSKPEAEAPQEMTAEELEVNAVLLLSLPLPQLLLLPAVVVAAIATAIATASCEFT